LGSGWCSCRILTCLPALLPLESQGGRQSFLRQPSLGARLLAFHRPGLKTHKRAN